MTWLMAEAGGILLVLPVGVGAGESCDWSCS